jgi:hypothetical protein
MISQTILDQVNSIIVSKYPNNKYVHSTTILVQATIPANQAAGTAANASMTINNSSFSDYAIPDSQVWLITDMYSSATSQTATDATATFVLNGTKVLQTSAPLSTNYVGNNTRPGVSSPMVFKPNSHITIPVAPIATAGTAVTTDTFFLSVTIYDSTFQ